MNGSVNALDASSQYCLSMQICQQQQIDHQCAFDSDR